MMRDNGCSISIAPQSVMQLGVGGGLPPIQQALDHGIRPSISVDVEVCLPGDFFTQMRILMAFSVAVRMNVVLTVMAQPQRF